MINFNQKGICCKMYRFYVIQFLHFLILRSVKLNKIFFPKDCRRFVLSSLRKIFYFPHQDDLPSVGDPGGGREGTKMATSHSFMPKSKWLRHFNVLLQILRIKVSFFLLPSNGCAILNASFTSKSKQASFCCSLCICSLRSLLGMKKGAF